MVDVKILYSKVIKDQNERPYHFEKRNDSTAIVKAYNPICGDRFELYLSHDGMNIQQVYFHGFGCAISKASTSLLVRAIEGKTMGEAMNICEKFLEFMDKKTAFDLVNLTDEFLAFKTVHDFPERYDCATLSFRELSKFLGSIESK